MSMSPGEIIDYCLTKPGAYIDYPFGPDTVVIKVEKRIFAQVFKLKDEDKLTLNCDAVTGQFYRDLYPGVITRGYHCPSVQQPYFNTIPLDGVVPDDMLIEMVCHSYKTVTGKLPKYIQKQLIDQAKK